MDIKLTVNIDGAQPSQSDPAEDGEHQPDGFTCYPEDLKLLGFFSKSCAAQFLFILCKSIVFYFMKEFISFCDLALSKSLARECLPVLKSPSAKGNTDKNIEAPQELLSIPTCLEQTRL